MQGHYFDRLWMVFCEKWEPRRQPPDRLHIWHRGSW